MNKFIRITAWSGNLILYVSVTSYVRYGVKSLFLTKRISDSCKEVLGQLRIRCPGAYSLVSAGGNARQEIDRDHKDYDRSIHGKAGVFEYMADKLSRVKICPLVR